MDDYGSTKMILEAVQARQIGGDVNYCSMWVQLAGHIRVRSPYGDIDERSFYGRQDRLLFALLVIERGRPVHRDELADALWPYGLPRTWEAALRGVISKVRTFLAAALLPDRAQLSGCFGGYQLDLPADVVIDVECARSAVETAERMLHKGDPSVAVKFAEHARSIAVRPFLPEATGCWVNRVREQLAEVLLSALCVLSEGYTQQHQYQLAARTAEDAIVLEPFRERTHQLLMRIHAAAGNPAEALRAYDRCRRLLAEELGVCPSAETAAIHLALLQNRL